MAGFGGAHHAPRALSGDRIVKGAGAGRKTGHKTGKHLPLAHHACECVQAQANTKPKPVPRRTKAMPRDSDKVQSMKRTRAECDSDSEDVAAVKA